MSVGTAYPQVAEVLVQAKQGGSPNRNGAMSQSGSRNRPGSLDQSGPLSQAGTASLSNASTGGSGPDGELLTMTLPNISDRVRIHSTVC